MRKVLFEVAHTGLAKIYGLLVAIAIVSLTARWLGPAGRGQLVVVTTCINFLAILGHLSLGQVAIHRARHFKEKDWLSRVFGSLLLICLVSSLLIGIAVLLTHKLAAGSVIDGLSSDLVLLICLALPFFLWEYHGSGLLISQGKIKSYNKWIASGRTLTLIVLLVGSQWGGHGVVRAVTAFILGQVLIAVGIAWSLSRDVERPRVSLSEIFELLKGGIKLHLNAIGVFVFGTVDVLLIGHYAGPKEAAYYQVAVQLVGVMLVLPQAVAMVLYGQVANSDVDSAWPQYRRVMSLAIAVTLAGSICAWLLAPYLISIIAGADFGPAVDLFRGLLLAVVGMAFSTTMAPQWIGRGFFVQAASITILVGLVAVCANLILIPLYGAKGAVAAAVLSYTVAAGTNLAMAVYCNRRFKYTRESRKQ